MPSVVFYMEDGSTLVHKLENEVTTIGRHSDSVVQLTCPSSSGRHATIKMTPEGVYVQDLGSSNGTRVNGAEIEEALLKDGDRIGFGDVQAVYYEGDPPAMAEESLPPPSGGVALPPPGGIAPNPPSIAPPQPKRPAPPPGRALSPVRRAYGNKASGYPDTTGSGCLTGMIVTGLFLAAFTVGLALRHSKDMDGNLFKDIWEKVSGGLPQIKIEKKPENDE